MPVISTISLQLISTPGHSTDLSCNLVSSHAASLLFMVFGLATLMDVDFAPDDPKAMEYYLLSRLCLRFVSPIHDTTLWAVQALVCPLMLPSPTIFSSLWLEIYQVKFLTLYDKPPTYKLSHTAWIITGFAVKLGHSVSRCGLHPGLLTNINSSRLDYVSSAGYQDCLICNEYFDRREKLSLAAR